MLARPSGRRALAAPVHLSDVLPEPAPAFRRRIEADFERFRDGLPPRLDEYVRERYSVDIRAEYAGRPIRNPFGKASGQLSLNARQVRRDVEAGLGFVVLKTVIAQDAAGRQSMAEWAVPETRMRVERIRGGDEEGWTVTWKGRGWSESFDAYRAFLREAAEIGAAGGAVVAPSVKYHLPGAGEPEFREEEYRFTTRALQEAWAAAAIDPAPPQRSTLNPQPARNASTPPPMPLEKDFSPTLAGDERSAERDRILGWLRRVPDLIRSSAAPAGVVLGVKMMNARFEPEFQVEMLRAVVDGPASPPDFLVYANRLFDPEREFEGKLGVAYGGPALSARNLHCLSLARQAAEEGGFRRPLPPISATGDILTGRRAVEYGLLGASSCQLHTLFQLPDSEFAARVRNKAEAGLHHLIFDPRSGLLHWLERLRVQAGRDTLSWLDLSRAGPSP